MRLSRVMAAALLAASSVSTQAVTVIHNFSGYQTTDKALIQFNAMAFDQGKVLETGSISELEKLYPDADTIDAKGKTLLPGLIDAHGHMLGLGQLNTTLDLRDQSLEEALKSIKRHAASLESGEWLVSIPRQSRGL
ncbi:amidohydrolase family protein [Microbulbifer epialgicus]|uniref:Amidohydrolase family protein n=1 Tax=Microbulbifer epialgicus TaxID=393907 RepID=A0ABV4NVW2_9GAMM